MKYVVYSGSRNLYLDMAIAATRLLSKQEHPEEYKIFFLIETDELGYPVPDNVECINVSKKGYKIFNPGGPNMKTKFTYLAMIRAAYSKVLPEYVDKLLQLDVDTVVMDDLSELWDIDMTDVYFAAVLERLSTWKPYGERYYNAGVMMINLVATCGDGVEDRMIDFLNNYRVPYIDQDAWNAFGVYKCLDLPLYYNETFVTGYTDHPKIVHYAGFKWHGEDKRCPRMEHRKEAEREYTEKYKEDLL